MTKILQYLWNGILFISAICILAIYGIVAIEFFKSVNSIFQTLIGTVIGSISIGLLVLLGYSFYGLINGKDIF